MHFPRPGPGSCRLPAPHGPGAAGAGGALRAAGAAAAAAGFTRDASIEAAAGDAVQGLALRLAVAQRLFDLFFESCFNAKLNAKHFSTSDADLGKKALSNSPEELEAKIHEGPVEVSAEQFT